MKIFARIKLAVISALLAAMFVTGSAWADEASVVKAITDFGLARKTGETGNTITIVNDSEKPLKKDVSKDIVNYWLLNLGDITGITIDWKADLTVTGKLNLEDPDDGISIVVFENGTFNMTEGTIDIQTTGAGWTNAIEAEGNSTVTVDGGTLRGTGASHCGIGGTESYDGKVIITDGTVYFPYGDAISTYDLTVNEPSVITGMTIVYTEKGDSHSVSADIYGAAYKYQSEPTEDVDTIAFTVKNRATWTLDVAVGVDMLLNAKSTFTIEENGELILDGEGWLDIDGTLINKGKFTNNSNIYNDSANSFYNYNPGMLINNGYILNGSKGKMTSTGTIDNTNGTIENEGVFESVQTPEEMGGEIEGPVQLIGNTSSGGGGCDAGFGMFGLLFAGLVALKKRR